MTKAAELPKSSGLAQQQDLGAGPEIHSKGCRKHWEQSCKKDGFIPTVTPQNPMADPQCLLAVLPSAVEALVQEPDPLFEIVVIVHEHPISHHLLLANAPLQLIPPPASQPLGPHDEVLRVDLETAQDPHVVVDPEQGPFLRPPIHLLRLRGLPNAKVAGQPGQGGGDGQGAVGLVALPPTADAPHCLRQGHDPAHQTPHQRRKK